MRYRGVFPVVVFKKKNWNTSCPRKISDTVVNVRDVHDIRPTCRILILQNTITVLHCKVSLSTSIRKTEFSYEGISQNRYQV